MAGPAPFDFKSAFDQLEQTVLITDRQGKIEYVNASFERIYGYTAGEIAGKSVRMLSQTTIAAAVYDDLWRGLISGVARRSIFKNQTRAGEVYDEDTSISLLKGPRGGVQHTIWVGRPAERKSTIEMVRRLVNSAPAGVVVFRNGRILFANEQFKQVAGYRERDLVELDPALLIHPEDRKAVSRHRTQLDARSYEYRLLKNNGEIRWVLESTEAVDFLGNGREPNPYTAGTIIDITDHKTAQEQLQYALTAYAATIEATTDAIIVVDTDRIVRQMNHRFADLWGLKDPQEYLGQSDARTLATMKPQVEDVAAFSELAHRAFENATEIDGSLKLHDGRQLELHTQPQIIDGEVAGIVWSFRDVTERERMQAALVDMANLDSLTRLPGRKYFQEQVEVAISRGEHGAVLFMDLDDFKAINDSLGHSAGDELLQSLAVCLSQELRHDDLLARLGGDEFAVLLRGASRSQAKKVAQRLLRSVREMKSISSDQPFTSTISIGGALFPTHGASVDELLGHADMAMYRVKREGRNSLHFYRATHGSQSNSRDRVVLRQKILNALENDGFVLHAQPIFELGTGRLGCYELLLRLKEPNGKFILPGRFLPIAERSGLMPEIDAWVIKRSLAIAQQLAMSPHPVKISFNLSAAAIGNQTLLDLIRRETARLKLDTDNVSIEVTETTLISDLPAAREFLNSRSSASC